MGVALEGVLKEVAKAVPLQATRIVDDNLGAQHRWVLTKVTNVNTAHPKQFLNFSG